MRSEFRPSGDYTVEIIAEYVSCDLHGQVITHSIFSCSCDALHEANSLPRIPKSVARLLFVSTEADSWSTVLKVKSIEDELMRIDIDITKTSTVCGQLQGKRTE